MISIDLLLAFGQIELMQFFWLSLLLDVPRYLIAMAVLAAVPPDRGTASNVLTVSAIVACHNEEASISACVASLRANDVGEIIIVNDGSTDRTHEVASSLGVIVIDLTERVGKPNAVNAGLQLATGDLILIADADTVFDPGSVALTQPFFEPDVGGVGMHLRLREETATLTTAYQAIEYAVVFSAGRRIQDALGILPNISGAAGIFRRAALDQVGGLDVEVAEDAALTMKLRAAGWKLRYATGAIARTRVPETPVDLILQRLRWDASIITIYWRKFGRLLNPFSKAFAPLASLDVLLFGVVLPLVLPAYLWWLWDRIDLAALVLLGAVMVALSLLDVAVVLLVGLPPHLLLYVPYYVVTQTLLMRPMRIVALIAELTFSITRYDPYLPRSQRWRLT